MLTKKDIPIYKCHKLVKAIKIAEITINENFETNLCQGKLIPVDVNFSGIIVNHRYLEKHKPKPGGYFVIYDDGYESFSPARAFESGYALLTEEG